nr:terminase large subunit [uncultured Mediterranean phage uvMED]BAR29177.1 terminase large subunit [uncultured Mediterranean phage uvMED]
MEYLQNMQIVLKNTNQTFKPPPDLKLSEWSDRYRKLSPESSAEAGQWNTSRAEYQREIMDTFNDPHIERIVVMTSSQVGKTEIILNAIGYYIDQDASPILIVQPTLQMGQAFSKDRLSAMIRDSEKLRGSVKDARSRDANNTTMHKKFAGGHLTIVGSNSASGLASRPIRILLMDEVDRYELSAGSEGSPIALAVARTKTFWNRKIFMCSTPTVKGLSAIESAFEESDKRYYYVPCPECEHKQVLKWKNVVWEEDKPETASYACDECGSVIEESKKQWMLKHGEWRATNEKSNTAGFHISELYSVWSTWSQMATNFIEAKKNPETLKTFINTALGESWEEQGDAVEYDTLLQRRLSYDKTTVPEEVLVITAGVDTQKDRLECQLVGWGKNYEAWVLDYKIFWGDPNAFNVWSDLDAYLKKRFKTETNRIIPISCTCIDSGGHHTNQVYQFTKPRQARRIFAIKGSSQAGKPIANRPTFVGKNKAVLYGVGTDTAKEAIFARLSTEPESTTLHFPNDVDEEYFKQLTAEKRVTKWIRGKKSLVWKQIRPRNEALDTLVYNFAAIYILNPNFDVIEQKILVNDAKPQQTTQKKTRKGINRQNFATSWK